jgi:transposase
MFSYFVGIDISKLYFDASVEVNGKNRHHQFPNNEKGFEAFLAWCDKWGVINAHHAMEATGAYWMALATWLHNQDRAVSVLNPARIRRFAQSELNRTKTAKVDAGIISRFCKAMSPMLWQPLPAEAQELQTLVRRLHDLTKMRQQERNRRALGSLDKLTLQSVERTLNFLELEIERLNRQIERLYRKHTNLRQKRDLLLSIPGVGEQTANVVLSEVPNPDLFGSAKQLAAYAGLAPKQIRSGDSIRGRTRMSKTGRSRLRSALYLPSVTARSCNPIVRSFCNRLLRNGKAPMKVVGAAI